MDATVIGGGVVGLACAAALARRGREVVVLERHARLGQEATSRNSEVIHAGLYYPAGSLKAELCVAGRRRLYERCVERGIPHRRTGKLVVATDASEVDRLESIRERGAANGAGALELIDAAELARREPRVRAIAALWSPESGIVDAEAVLQSYQAEAESAGAVVVTHTEVIGLERRGSGWLVDTRSADGERASIEVASVVNSAGVSADSIAALAGIDVDAAGYRVHPCKGDYFALAPSLGQITRHLVYPVPVPGGLGTHVTLDLGGRYRLGPDVEYVSAPRLDVDPGKAETFAAAVRRYLPEVRPEHLTPDYAGIRAKLQPPGGEFRDFVVEEGSAHGAPALVNLLGIESPGLTAAGEIAERVADLANA